MHLFFVSQRDGWTKLDVSFEPANFLTYTTTFKHTLIFEIYSNYMDHLSSLSSYLL
jgi:hypothetical protein